MVSDVLREIRSRAIAGGSHVPADAADRVVCIDRADFDWLLERVATNNRAFEHLQTLLTFSVDGFSWNGPYMLAEAVRTVARNALSTLQPTPSNSLRLYEHSK
jgi:hypothetical protein